MHAKAKLTIQASRDYDNGRVGVSLHSGKYYSYFILILFNTLFIYIKKQIFIWNFFNRNLDL